MRTRAVVVILAGALALPAAVCAAPGAPAAPPADRSEVRFTIGARGKRSTVGIEFRPAEPTNGSKAVIEALVEHLRERPDPPASAAVRA